jgi:glycosyltransferase involved in cell wall biosynthesis
VIAVLDDQELGRLMGEKARASLLADFRWQQAAGRLQEFYQRCLGLR